MISNICNPGVSDCVSRAVTTLEQEGMYRKLLDGAQMKFMAKPVEDSLDEVKQQSMRYVQDEMHGPAAGHWYRRPAAGHWYRQVIPAL